MIRAPLLGLFAASAGVVAGAWWLLDIDGPAGDASGFSTERLGADSRADPVLHGLAARSAPASTAPEAGRGTISGRVTRGGAPVEADVEVRVLVKVRTTWLTPRSDLPLRTPESAPAPFARARSRADGTFVLAGIPMGSFEVSARSAEGARARRRIEVVANGSRARTDLELLEPGLELLGLARTTTGAPVAGRVAAWPSTGAEDSYWEEAPGRGTTSAPLAEDGSFALAGLVAGPHVLRIYLAEGGVVLGPVVTLPTSERVEIVVSQAVVMLRGRLVGEPGAVSVADAVVVAFTSGPGGESPTLRQTASDVGGRFALLVPAGRLDLRVAAAGYPIRWHTVVHPEEDVVVRLPRACRVEGRVFSLDGGPAAGARVVADPRGENECIAWADAEGRYALTRVAPGATLVQVLGGGWATPGLGTETAERMRRSLLIEAAPGTSVEHDLVAERSIRLEGRVLAADGSPVSGATVTCGSPKLDFGFGFEDLRIIDLVETDFDFDPPLGVSASESVATDVDGHFAVPDLARGANLGLTAWAPNHPPIESTTGPLEPPGPANVTLRFAAPRMVEVRVSAKDDGRPVAGALVRLGAEPEGADSNVPAISGPDGRARLGPVGTSALRVVATLGDSEGSAYLEVDDGAGARTRQVDVSLELGLEVRGRVMRADGTAAAAANVTLVEVVGDGRRDVTARSDGTFRVGGLSPGRWIVSASHEEAASERSVTTAGSEGLVVKLGAVPRKEHRTVRARVLDAEGLPVPGFTLRIVTEATHWTMEGVEGRAEFALPVRDKDASAGGASTRLEAFGAHGGDGQPLNLARTELPGLPEGQDEVELRMKPGLRIEGRVLLSTGKPARYVSVKRWAGDASARYQSTTIEMRTDPTGRFRFVGLEPGPYTLGVEAPPGQVAAPPTTVSAGAADVLLTLRAAVTHRLRVLAADGSPLPEAYVYLHSPGKWESERSDEEGRVTFEDLDPSVEWDLRVQPPSDRRDLVTLHEEASRLVDGDLRLARGRLITGFVRDAFGEGIERALVFLADTGRSEPVKTGKDGAFRLGPMPEGNLHLRAQLPPLRPGDTNEGTRDLVVGAGVSEVVITLDTGRRVNVRVEGMPEETTDRARVFCSRAGSEPAGFDVTPGREAGSYVLLGLDPEARYVFWLPVDDTRHVVGDIDPGGGNVTLRVREGRTIRGRVVNSPLGDRVQVEVANAKGIHSWAYSDREGRFAIEGLPAGPWRVTCTETMNGIAHEAVAEVEAGGTADLILKPVG